MVLALHSITVSNYPTDCILHPLLQEHRTQLRLLQPQWTNILQSDIQIKSAIAGAAETANRLLGIQLPIVLDWVPTGIVQAEPLDCDAGDGFSVPKAYERIGGEDSEDVVAEDAIEEEIEGLVDSESMAVGAAVDIVWKLPVRDYPYAVLRER